MKEPTLKVGEGMTPDARLLLRLVDMVERDLGPLSEPAVIAQANLTRVLRRAAALLHEQDRQPRAVNEHVAH